MTAGSEPNTGRDRPPLVSVALLGWFGVSFSALLSFYLPLAVVPADLMARGAGPVVAGWVVTILVGHAVAAELLAPRIMARTGPVAAAAGGLALMAAPAILMGSSPPVGAVLALTAVRGAGFGLVVVVIGARVAALLPPERRGEGLGWAGVVACVPAVAGLPAGVWLADQYGAASASVAAGMAATAGLAALPFACRVTSPPHMSTHGGPPAGSGVLTVACRPGQRRPATGFLLVVSSVGVLIAFLPTLTAAGPQTVGLALMLHSLAATLARLLAGRLGDRRGHRTWLRVGIVGAAAGLAPLILAPSDSVVLGAMVVSGAAFGAAQSSSLALMIEDAEPQDLPAVSSVWNATFDLGLGLGPLAFGVALTYTPAPIALLMLVGAVLTGLPVVRRGVAANARPIPTPREAVQCRPEPT